MGLLGCCLAAQSECASGYCVSVWAVCGRVYCQSLLADKGMAHSGVVHSNMCGVGVGSCRVVANNRPVSVFVGFELLSECGQQPQRVWTKHQRIQLHKLHN